MNEKLKLILWVILFIVMISICSYVINKEDKFLCATQNINEVDIENVANESNNNQVENNIVDSENILNVEGEKENMNTVLEVTSENFESEVLKSETKVLVDFYATWCVPCQMLSPIVEKVASEIDGVKIVKVNVDEVVDVASKYGVMSIPTLVVIENGKEINRSLGLIDENEIKDLLK